MIPEALSWLEGTQMRVELDKKSIFALASDTRLEILKSLKPMRRTVSQLSEELNIDKGAVHRHLKKMEEGGLVKRHEDHGFVYYGLTWMARDLIMPNENTRVVIVLSAIWLLSLAFAFIMAAGLMSESGNDTLVDILPLGGETDEASREYSATLDEAEPMGSSWSLPVVVVGVIIALLCIVLFRMVRVPVQKSPEDSEVDGSGRRSDGSD